MTGGRLMDRFIGLSVEQTKNHIAIHLDRYIEETLEEYQKLISKSLRPKSTPMQPGNTLSSADCPDVPEKRRQAIYRSMVARLQFAATWVRFDISFAVAQLARFCASAGSSHWSALHHLMEYLSKYPSFKLTYSKQLKSSRGLDVLLCNQVSKGLDGYCDADWGTSDTRRSTTGIVFRYNGAPILWRSKMH